MELEKALGEFAQESFFRKYVDFLELPNRSECEKLGIKWPTADKEAEEKAAQQKEAVENKQKVVKKFSKQAVTKQKAPETNTIQQNIFNKRLPTADQNVSKQQAIPDRALSPLQPEAVKMDLKGYMHYGNNNAKDMQENEVKTLLTQFADRGLVSESVLRENGVRPKWSEHKDGNEIEMVVDSLPNAGGNWAANEQNAIKAYRAAARPDEMVPRSPPVMLAAGMPYYADHIDASFDARMVHFVGLPEGLTYSRLCIYIKGGPVDSIHIEEDQHVATIVFLHTKDAVNYRRHMTANEYYIDGVRLIPSYSVTPRLANMRLWEPERVLREGISRCVFIEGLPNGTTEYLLKQDLRSLNPVVRIDFESIIVEGVCARIATPGVAMGNYVQRSIGMHPKYTGVRVRYEEDYSSAHISTVGKPFRR